MKTFLLFSTLFLGLSALIVPKASGQEYELVWSDEFNGSELDTSIWKYETGGGNNNELQYYTTRDTNNWVGDGKLTLRALKENYSGKAYTSTRINSAGKFNFKYGKVEAYMKLPYGQGIWPAFWMLGESISTVGWPNCGEIDIMEMVGGVTTSNKGDNVINSTLHWGPYDANGGHPAYGEKYTLPTGKFADKYHLVSTVWDDKVLRTYCDSVLFYTISLSPKSMDAFDANFFLILNLAVGGDWPGSPNGSTVFPQTFEIDYVRIYKSKETLTIDGNTEVFPADSSLQYKVVGGSDWTYEWLLPEGASAISAIDSSVVLVNWGCTDATLKCHVSGTVIDDTVSLNIKVKQPAITGPLFFTDNETGLEFSFPTLHSTMYTWEVPVDATLTSGQGTPIILVDWGTISDSVKLQIQNVCGTTSYAQLLLPQGQYPYPDPFTAHAIPGTIQSVDYDYGGEGIAYHDNEVANQGPGPREDEGVDTENNDGGSNVGWITSGEWLEYTVSVAETREYKIEVRVATQLTSGISPINIYFNGENRTGDITVSPTGGWATFKTISVAPVSLFATDNLMKLDFGGGGYNVGRITISEYTAPAVENVSNLVSELTIYPNPSSGNIQVSLPSGLTEINLLDLAGKVILHVNLEISKRYELETRDLSPGMYIINAKTLEGNSISAKFIKE